MEPTPMGGPAGAPVTDLQDVVFAPALEVNLDAMEEQESGLYIQVLREGDGPPAVAGDSMGVDYTVWFPDGTKLDSSHDHMPPVPLPMVLGETRLIDGWVEGVTGMRVGEKRRLVLPYDLAYGAAGRPGVPPYSPLVFELELAQLASGGGS
jgi:peptidylprolyl isomerase